MTSRDRDDAQQPPLTISAAGRAAIRAKGLRPVRVTCLRCGYAMIYTIGGPIAAFLATKRAWQAPPIFTRTTPGGMSVCTRCGAKADNVTVAEMDGWEDGAQ